MPPKKGKTPALHVKCDPIPVGTVITDTKKLEITVQKEFAQGGFGRICDAKVKGSSAKYIIKFEPTDNGPLFNENHLYPRILTQTALQKYISEHKLKFLGLPHCVSSGVYKDVRYLVMPKYDYTLEQLIKEKKGVLPLGNTVSVVLSVLDSLEYIHSCDYAHGDIKAGNLMLMSKSDFTKVYLIDYGLAKKISKPVEKDDPKKAHNGTALFNSMDAHRGCGPSFRGDIEILAHNVLLWLTGKLPWKNLEDNPNAVQSAKADLLSNIPKNVKALVPDQKSAALLITLYDAAKKLKIEQKPNFAAIKKAIGSPEAASKRKRGAAESEEEIDKPTPRSRARKQESENEEEEEEEEKPKPRGRARVKKEEAPTEPEEEAEEPKPSKSRPRKAGAAIAAAKKSKVIYPGLNKKPSTEKSDDDEESADEASPPVPKKSKPPSTKSSTVRSRRPPASDSPVASSSEGRPLPTTTTTSTTTATSRTLRHQRRNQ
uniref:non-specific serine/threonine protein kinase n=1 Tax=Panagrellus redivivus TaxID=6233 RepID=A0A7E4W0I9_PANRE